MGLCHRRAGPGGAELRPYGKDGSLICFDCMTADPVREDEAKMQFKTQLEAAEKNGIVVLTDGGIKT